jgi:hypothetical protein
MSVTERYGCGRLAGEADVDAFVSRSPAPWFFPICLVVTVSLS